MIKSETLDGVIGVINTPFTRNSEVDCDSLRRYVAHALKCRVKGFLVPAMAAEVYKLNARERTLIVKTVLSETGGQVPVIGGASAGSQRERIGYVTKLNEMGCDGVLVNIPFQNEETFIADLHEIAALQPGFLMIQDWDFEGSGIPLPVIVRLFEEIELFRFLKVEVKPAGTKYTAVRRATAGKLHVSGGWAVSQMIEALDRGVNAFMSTILHDIYYGVFSLYRSGDRTAAQKLFNDILPVLAFSHQHLDISIHFNKRYMHRLGLYTTPNVRRPIIQFDDFHLRVADELIDRAMEISQNLSHYGRH